MQRRLQDYQAVSSDTGGCWPRRRRCTYISNVYCFRLLQTFGASSGMHIMQLGRLGCRQVCAGTSCTNCGVLQLSGILLLPRLCGLSGFL
jgi:hypothetical protein